MTSRSLELDLDYRNRMQSRYSDRLSLGRRKHAILGKQSTTSEFSGAIHAGYGFQLMHPVPDGN